MIRVIDKFPETSRYTAWIGWAGIGDDRVKLRFQTNDTVGIYAMVFIYGFR